MIDTQEQQAKDHIRDLLEFIGEDPNREGLLETPARVIKAYGEWFAGYKQDPADLFKVFSDTTRIKILYALMGRELCVADIAEATATSQSAVSHQLRTLKQSHLVKFRRDGRNILYSLADDHVYTMLNQGMSHICE